MANDRFAQRRIKLLALLKKQKLPGLLVTNPQNVTYLSGFTGEDSYLFVSREKTLLISDSRFTVQIAEECPDVECAIRTAKTTMPQFLAKSLETLVSDGCAIESRQVTLAQMNDWREALPSTSFAATSNLVEELRQIKDADEIEQIRLAVAQAEKGFIALKAIMVGRMTELEASAELEHFLRRFGAKGVSFEPIIAAGPRAALPHGRASEQLVGGHPLVLIDWGAKAQSGYVSDLTRVLITGKLSKTLETVYRTVLGAQLAAIAKLAPGVKCADVDAAARQVIEAAGFGKQFGHGTGHGLGRDVHERPSLGPISTDVLQPGMVVTVEPGIYLPGIGGVRIEDDVLITRSGHEVLSSLPKDLESQYHELA